VLYCGVESRNGKRDGSRGRSRVERTGRCPSRHAAAVAFADRVASEAPGHDSGGVDADPGLEFPNDLGPATDLDTPGPPVRTAIRGRLINNLITHRALAEEMLSFTEADG
jgi:hypothetical protein